ncbi:PucR family transcriptional regulator [Gordonia sp. (in: high G+C Gram-positive bacteria)]|uniref:PucR family transcriptional regulator n=1 Tax=Gordonia sp. (in: high G+C Gram-positive bacteria) TaxID=84139 RepID=UPI002C6EE1B1|nr:helix-turn-helix domain-containing protein [Gordonia sp. (in: high G+C Gram-positive bacteria)]HMS76168.1 helix-turn-helix domain-containing protein [Gordonia sp. (in: high G+C Gram-positive bacteria)]
MTSRSTEWLIEFTVAQADPGTVATFVRRTADGIRKRTGPLPDDVQATIAPAIEEHWRAFLSEVTTTDQGVTELVPAAHRLAVLLATHHLDLSMLLRIYQAAQTASWDFAVAVVKGAPADLDRTRLLIWFWTKASRWFTASIELSVAVYQEEFNRIRQRGDTRRHELVAGVLAGNEISAAELSAELGGYRVSGVRHVAGIAHALTADVIEQLEPTVTALSAALRGAGMTVVRPGGRELWGWIAAPAVGVADLDAAATDIDASQVRLTVGGPAAGLAGFIAAHRDALMAQRVALSPVREVAVTEYSQVAALTLLALDHESAARFARDTLGPLADSDQRHLRDTVRIVLTSPESADVVAARLGVHKNTVRYRVQQAERMLDRPLQTGAGDLLLAIDYLDAFPID